VRRAAGCSARSSWRGREPHQTPLFDLAEPCENRPEVFAAFCQCAGGRVQRLLLNFVQQHDAARGFARFACVSDFDMSFQLAGMNRNLYPEVETLF